MEMNALPMHYHCWYWTLNKYFLTPVPLFSCELRGPTTACVTLHNAVSDVIQHPELTDRRIILVIAGFVTVQSSRPLYVFKHVKSLSRPSQELFDLNLCYLSSHAGADHNQNCRFQYSIKHGSHLCCIDLLPPAPSDQVSKLDQRL